MSGTWLDRLTRGAGRRSRRTALATALRGAAIAATTIVPTGSAVEAKKGKKCKSCKPKSGLGEQCTANKDCCADKTNLACSVPNNDPVGLVCCGAFNGRCRNTGQCCQGFACLSGFCTFP